MGKGRRDAVQLGDPSYQHLREQLPARRKTSLQYPDNGASLVELGWAVEQQCRVCVEAILGAAAAWATAFRSVVQSQVQFGIANFAKRALQLPVVRQVVDDLVGVLLSICF